MPLPERLNPPGVFTPQVNYSQVVRAGNTLYIAGQIGVDPEGKLVGPGDPAAQAEQCYRNLKAIVKHFGGTLDNIVKVTNFITDLSYRPLIAAPRDRHFGAPGPASTLVVVQSLAAPEYLIEVEAIAVLDD